MNVEYKKELGKNYLILEPGQTEDDFCVQMLTENRIHGLLPFERRTFNGEVTYYFDITGKHSMENRAQQELLKEKDIRKLLQSLYGTVGEMYAYFLESDRLLTMTSYIYEDEKEIYFCCYPDKNPSTDEGNLTVLAEQLQDLIDYDDEGAVMLSYGFYKKIKESEKGLLSILEDVLTEETEFAEDEAEDVSENISEETEEEDRESAMLAEKPDFYTIVLFLISFLVSLCYLGAAAFSGFLSVKTGIIAGVFVLACIPGMAAGFVNIDIARKK